MLSVEGTNDKTILNRLSLEIFNKEFEGGVGYVLRDDGKEIGLADLKVNPNVSEIICISVLPSYRKKGYGDFFTRAIMNVLSGVSDEIQVNYNDDYFLKFGFEIIENGMKIKSSSIIFPHKCKH